eukprot:CAMPEP_0169323200 /NCGR_PEP_ID=MMETSP1017-20121227/9823_1 /TAXON_ID=342587 /ORGANISM="Karlodinium micrum, Strain CCMP2283" /LENGTH=225 /DNA_ID=CAMNT_0009417787 /DNA_START=39 /DNA_END=713 /DNA_ORIENTATION=+
MIRDVIADVDVVVPFDVGVAPFVVVLMSIDAMSLVDVVAPVDDVALVGVAVSADVVAPVDVVTAVDVVAPTDVLVVAALDVVDVLDDVCFRSMNPRPPPSSFTETKRPGIPARADPVPPGYLPGIITYSLAEEYSSHPFSPKAGAPAVLNWSTLCHNKLPSSSVLAKNVCHTAGFLFTAPGLESTASAKSLAQSVAIVPVIPLQFSIPVPQPRINPALAESIRYW